MKTNDQQYIRNSIMRLECIIVNALDEAGWGEVAGKCKLLVSGDL
jgi:hypothetical protein